MEYIEKRAYRRIKTNIEARFFYGNIFYSGKILDLSEKGMYINTKRCLPHDSMFVVILNEGEELLKVIAKVKRISVGDEGCRGMGVELLSPSVGYLEFINKLRSHL